MGDGTIKSGNVKRINEFADGEDGLCGGHEEWNRSLSPSFAPD